eukprot:GHRR01013142.1.p1 GENE.GHRR01013142.1~~GHRR01013142.1.p1  ORF type:complete len:251 (+),score=69.89 GHRR01013142.1:324-1076(+)
MQAKWALDAAGVDYNLSAYPSGTAFYIQELPLRWRLGRLTGKITAPIFLPKGNPREVIMDSTAVARWADEHSSNPGKLFPKGAAEESKRWVKASNSLLSLFRRELAAAGSAQPAIVDAMLPPSVTGLNRVLGKFVMTTFFKKLVVKYEDVDQSAQYDQVRAELLAARQTLADNTDKLLIPAAGLTYADIAFAVAVNKVAQLNVMKLPAEKDAQPQTIATCAPEMNKILQEFGDLVQWAADLIKQHWVAGP